MPHPLQLSIEVSVTEKSANERGGFVLAHVHHNEAIASMTQTWLIEIGFTRKEGYVSMTS